MSSTLNLNRAALLMLCHRTVVPAALMTRRPTLILCPQSLHLSAVWKRIHREPSLEKGILEVKETQARFWSLSEALKGDRRNAARQDSRITDVAS